MNKIKKYNSHFTTVSNTILRDSNLSFKAKGLFAYMYSMADGWNFTIKSIATQQRDGYDAVKSGIAELKQHGYIIYEKHSDGTGTYTLIDEPKVENPHVENPIMGKSTPIKKEQLTKKNNGKEFTPPSLEDISQYIQEKKLSVSAKKFFDYFEAGNWIDAKGNKVRNWKQKLLTWDNHAPKSDNKVQAKKLGGVL